MNWNFAAPDSFDEAGMNDTSQSIMWNIYWELDAPANPKNPLESTHFKRNHRNRRICGHVFKVSVCLTNSGPVLITVGSPEFHLQFYRNVQIESYAAFDWKIQFHTFQGQKSRLDGVAKKHHPASP